MDAVGEAPPSRQARWKTGFGNAALLLASIAVFYLVGEFLFFRFALPHLSMNLRPHLPDRADFFLQNSKAGYVPRDYIALVGDSYAQGMGDWLLSVGGKNDKPYHSGNVIHDLVGRDVATFGRAAAGSAEALVLRTTRILGDSDCYLFPPIEQPRRFFIYFYEGNDIDENNRLYQRMAKAGYSGRPDDVDGFIAREYGAASPWRCHGNFGDMIFRMARFVVRERFAAPPVIDQPAGINTVTIAGKPVPTPELEVPSVNLDARQTADGMAVYERSLAWFRTRFPDTPTTVVYIPSAGATYRHANAQVIAKNVYQPEESRRTGKHVMIDGSAFDVAQVYARSQALCEMVRAATLKEGVSFIDARPAFRAAAAQAPLHGPRDWHHPNEAGYRVLGALVAAHVDDRPADACDDRRPE